MRRSPCIRVLYTYTHNNTDPCCFPPPNNPSCIRPNTAAVAFSRPLSAAACRPAVWRRRSAPCKSLCGLWVVWLLVVEATHSPWGVRGPKLTHSFHARHMPTLTLTCKASQSHATAAAADDEEGGGVVAAAVFCGGTGEGPRLCCFWSMG